MQNHYLLQTLAYCPKNNPCIISGGHSYLPLRAHKMRPLKNVQFLFKITEGENFSRRNTLSILRINAPQAH